MAIKQGQSTGLVDGLLPPVVERVLEQAARELVRTGKLGVQPQLLDEHPVKDMAVGNQQPVGCLVELRPGLAITRQPLQDPLVQAHHRVSVRLGHVCRSVVKDVFERHAAVNVRGRFLLRGCKGVRATLGARKGVRATLRSRLRQGQCQVAQVASLDRPKFGAHGLRFSKT